MSVTEWRIANEVRHDFVFLNNLALHVMNFLNSERY